MTRLAAPALALVSLVAGCSLPREAIGPPGTTIDAGGLADDAASVHDAWVAPGTDSGTDAAATNDAYTAPGDDAGPGGCSHDGDCPADVVTLGTCVYADTCATTGAQDQTTTHTICDHHVCTPQVTTTPVMCTRETDGDPCGPRACDPCSATACGGMGTQSCTGPMCQGGGCSSMTVTVSCTTPDDMCGALSPWSGCYYDIGRGRCVQTRSWGGCVLGTCIGRTGQTETRDCTC